MNPTPKKTTLRPLTGRQPSLFDLWTTYKFNTGVLAIKAKVPPGTIQAMFGNQPISYDHAHKVLAALSVLLKKEFTLQTVYVACMREVTQP